MSLRALLRRDQMTILEPGVVKDASGGGTLPGKPPLYTHVIGRLEPAASQETTTWGTAVFVHTHTFFTYEKRLKPGLLLRSSDDEIMVIKGIKKHRRMGGLSTYFECMCEETQE